MYNVWNENDFQEYIKKVVIFTLKCIENAKKEWKCRKMTLEFVENVNKHLQKLEEM